MLDEVRLKAERGGWMSPIQPNLLPLSGLNSDLQFSLLAQVRDLDLRRDAYAAMLVLVAPAHAQQGARGARLLTATILDSP